MRLTGLQLKLTRFVRDKFFLNKFSLKQCTCYKIFVYKSIPGLYLLMKYIFFVLAIVFALSLITTSTHAASISLSYKPAAFTQTSFSFKGGAQLSYKPVQAQFTNTKASFGASLAYSAPKLQTNRNSAKIGLSYNIRTYRPTWSGPSASLNAGINPAFVKGGAKFTASPSMQTRGGTGLRAVKTGNAYLRVRTQPGRFLFSDSAMAGP